jgi:hypothetical protein
MPTQAWYAYFVAGLGVVLVVLGLLRYWQSHPLTRQRLSAEAKGYHDQRPRARFSGQLGIEHKVLMGKKILFEFDPSTPYQTVVRDFALECVANKEQVIVLTPTGSVVHKAVEGDKGISVINLAPDTMLSAVLEEHSERPLNFIYDGLTDLALSTDPRTAYRFAMNSLRQLSDPRITAIFLLNPSAHELKDVSSFRGVFSSQLVCGKDGLSSVKLE